MLELALLGLATAVAAHELISVASAHAALGQVARRFGLSQAPQRLLHPGRVSGVLHDFQVVLETFRATGPRLARLGREHHSKGGVYTRISVAAPGRLPSLLWLERSTLISLGRSVGEHDRVFTGDEPFDQEIITRGELRSAMAALSGGARQLARVVLPGLNAELRGGALACAIRGLPGSGEALSQMLEQLLALVARLAIEPGGLEARLCANLLSEPNPEVRRRLFRLAVSSTDPQRTGEVLRFALEAEDPALRLLAVRHLGRRRLRVALAIACDRGAEPAARADALALLGERLSRRRLLPVLRALLLGTPFPVRNLAIELTARLRAASLFDRLLPIVGHGPVETQQALALALVELRPKLSAEQVQAAERKLWPALAAEDVRLRLAAAFALGAVGSVASVPRLVECTRGLGRLELKRAAAAAIERIQSSAVHAGHGQLSVVSDRGMPAGALSVSEEGGALSLEEEDQGAAVGE